MQMWAWQKPKYLSIYKSLFVREIMQKEKFGRMKFETQTNKEMLYHFWTL
jgi:hypothetical protein